MKEIQPISIWHNGSSLEATIFNLIGESDNLIDSAKFSYQLYTQDNIVLASGYLSMSGDDYIIYSSNPDSNNYAYSWGATQLNITLV